MTEPHEDRGELELRDYLDVIRRRKLTIAFAVVVVVAAALTVSYLQTPVYESTAEVLLQARTSERIFAPDIPGVAQERTRVQTEIEVMRSRSVRDAVEAGLGQEAAVHIRARGDTDVVAISAESTVPEEAARVANTFAEVYIETRREQLVEDLLAAAEQVQSRIEGIDVELSMLDADDPADAARRQALFTQRAALLSQAGELQLATNLTRTGGAQIVSAAEVPEDPIRPTPERNAALAVVVGLILGIGLAFLREYLDDTITTKDDTEEATGLTAVALIPVVPGWRDRHRAQVVSVTEPTAPASEAYRSLRTSVQFLGIERPLKVLQLTSPGAAEGKTTTLVNLGVALARAGQRVVLVDCDLRRPRLHEFFDLPNAEGFTSALLGLTGLAQAVRTAPGHERLYVLPSGRIPPNPSELLASGRAGGMLEALKAETDVVLVDSPPVLPVSDAAALSRYADGILLVVKAGSSTKRDAHRAVEVLHQVSAPLIGAVLNSVEPDSGYGYAYGEPYDSSSKARRRKRGPVAAEPPLLVRPRAGPEAEGGAASR